MQPTVVLVHGAFADSSSWNGIVDPLQQAGHQVVAASNPLRGIASDAAHVTDLVRAVEGPVVLVGHSYGGAVITNVPSDAGDVVGLVYVGAFAPDAGETVAELAGRFPGGTLADTLWPVPLAEGGVDLYIAQDRYHDQFAADVDEALTKQMGATQRPIAEAAFGETSGEPLWKALPSWFLIGELDKNIPAAAQRFMAERAGAKRVIEVPGASHVVGISHGDKVVELIREAVATHSAAPA